MLDFKEKTKKIITNLTNKLFNHFFIIIGNVLLNYIMFVNAAYKIIIKNLFAYIIINQYLFDKFYGIIIITNIFKYLIIDYG